MTPRISPDGDAEELRTIVREFLHRHTEPADDPDVGWHTETWERFAAEIGAVGLDVPEEYGGAGAGFREVAVVAEELGRSLARLPWYSTAVLGVGVLTHSPGSESLRADLLPQLVAGRTTATLAYRAPLDAHRVPTTYARIHDPHSSWRLTGTKVLVVEGATADLLFVSAETESGTALFLVDGSADGLTRTPLTAMDPNRQLADIELNDTPATIVCTPEHAETVLDHVLRRATAALACEQTGGTAAAMDLAVDYAAQRRQFGRPIATFQAIKHRCADMAVRLEAARSASLWAVATIADDPAAAPAAAATAALVCADAYTWVAAENVQVHGGIGFTWEHPAHLHVRRAATSAALLGDARSWREQLLVELGV